MRGKLYSVGIGPGDPELMTLKAVRLLEECDVIAFPKGDTDVLIAKEIISKVVDVEEKEQLIASNFKIESPFLSNVGGRLGDKYQNLDEIMSKECFAPLRDNERYKKLLIDIDAFKERLK